MTSLDLDDFGVTNHRLDLLDELKRRVPDLKVTLFTVPNPEGLAQALPSRPDDQVSAHVRWLATVKENRPWLEFALHGWDHSYLECRTWDRYRAINVLLWAEATGIFVKGFRAPYWETSRGLYQALLERGWWIGDHDRNDAARPAALPVYKLDHPGRVHGHVQDWGSNGLQEMWDTYAALRGPFAFVSEIMGAT